VPLDGAPGTSSRDLEVVARGLAQSLGESGEIVVVSDAGLVGRLTTIKQQSLQEARDATTEGTLLLSGSASSVRRRQGDNSSSSGVCGQLRTE
jgi:hypothetical protein